MAKKSLIEGVLDRLVDDAVNGKMATKVSTLTQTTVPNDSTYLWAVAYKDNNYPHVFHRNAYEKMRAGSFASAVVRWFKTKDEAIKYFDSLIIEHCFTEDTVKVHAFIVKHKALIEEQNALYTNNKGK